MQQNVDTATQKIADLAKTIDSHTDWWRFPAEPGGVRGFLGTASVFIVGDQPSTSEWEANHPHRRAFYGVLVATGLKNAHLTDLYKKRGTPNELADRTPLDFDEHIRFFRDELQILKPTRVIALGNLAHRLLSENVPEVCPILEKMLHFGALHRVGRDVWIARVSRSLQQGSSPPLVPISSKPSPSRVLPNSSSRPRPGTQRAVMCEFLVATAGDVDAAVLAYADAEKTGKASRERNASGLSGTEYGYALVKDGLRRGWLMAGA